MFFMFTISGGKDSCYNMMQCIQQGHVIVALANLKPRDGGTVQYVGTWDHFIRKAIKSIEIDSRKANLRNKKYLTY